jgi:hypothetical protein
VIHACEVCGVWSDSERCVRCAAVRGDAREVLALFAAQVGPDTWRHLTEFAGARALSGTLVDAALRFRETFAAVPCLAANMRQRAREAYRYAELVRRCEAEMRVRRAEAEARERKRYSLWSAHIRAQLALDRAGLTGERAKTWAHLRRAKARRSEAHA